MTVTPPDYWEYEGSRRKPRWLPRKTPAQAARDRYEQPPDSGVSVRAATDALQDAPGLDRFTEVFDHTVDDEHGAFPRIHQFLESAANWCDEHGAPNSAATLTSYAIRLEELIEDIRLLPEELSAELTTQALLAAQTRAPIRPPPVTTSTSTPAPPPAAGTTPATPAPSVKRR
ncbi:hypothetical protein ACFXKG_28390 [Streptomyces sp. NPDC059255]|uniref:hypothetical protein n=1 Tax=Streptomyces sp. NPDC059255 TaxID=3346793 RepID=UPI0036BFA896